MSTGDGEGPAWNKFWMSMGDDETGSMMSGEGSSHHPYTPDARSLMSPDHGRPGMMDRLDSVLPNDSASHAGVPDSPDQSTFAGSQSSGVKYQLTRMTGQRSLAEIEAKLV